MHDNPTIIRGEEATSFSLQNIQTNEVFAIENEVSIGRQQGCDIELLQGHVSRLHAIVSIEGLSLKVKDQGSANGTYLNGEKITEAILNNGDLLSFDMHEFLVLIEEPEKNIHEQATQIRSETLQKSEDILDLGADQAPEQEQDATLVQTEAPQVDSDATLIQEANSAENAPAPKEQAAPKAQEPQERTAIWSASEQTEGGTVLLDTESLAAQKSAIPIQHLFGYNSDIKGKKFSLNKDKLVLGKSSLADIIIKDSSVSSRHAEISFERGQWSLSDLNSTNGSYINNTRLKHKTLLNPGDLLQFGVVQLVFGQELPAGASASKFLKPLKIALGSALALSFIFFVAYFINTQVQFSSGQEWLANLPKNETLRASNAAESESLLLHSLNTVYDLDIDSGKQLSSLTTTQGICAAHKSDNQYFVLNFQGKLEILNGGAQHYLNGPGLASMCHIQTLNYQGNKRLVISHNNGHALFDPSHNRITWQESNSPASATFSLLILNDQSKLVLADLDGTVSAKTLQGESLAPLWSLSLDRLQGPYLLKEFNNIVVAYNPAGSLTVIDSNSGSPLWNKRFPLAITDITVGPTGIYLASQNKISKHNLSTGVQEKQLELNKKIYGLHLSQNSDNIKAIVEGPDLVIMDTDLVISSQEALNDISTPETIASSRNGLVLIDANKQVAFFE